MKTSLFSTAVLALTVVAASFVADSASACRSSRSGGGYCGGYRSYSYSHPTVYVKRVYVPSVAYAPVAVSPAPLPVAAPQAFAGPPAVPGPFAGPPPANYYPGGAGLPAASIGSPGQAFPPGYGYPPQNPVPPFNSVPEFQGGNYVPPGGAINPQLLNGGPAAGPYGDPNAFAGANSPLPNPVQPNVPQSNTPPADVAAALATPPASISLIAVEQALPSVAIGSILTLQAPSLGNERGEVRLTVDGLSLPVEILEWTAAFIKVQLPSLNVTRARRAEIEILRAQGGLASKSAIELTPATDRLTLGQ